MDDVGLLLKAYWEQLHDRLAENRGPLSTQIEILLKAELDRQKFPDIDEHKYAAYREVSLAFVEERIETYNPVGLQYLFDASKRREAAELEFELDWFNSRREFNDLVDAAARNARQGMTDEQLRQAVCELIRSCGAYPDRSIIAGYETNPTSQKLADYVVARAIEELIRH